MEVVTRHGIYRDADDFWDGVEDYMRHVQEWFWSEEDKERCGSLVEGVVKHHINGKYGKGRLFKMTWGAVLATGRKPSRVSKCWSLVWGLPCGGSSVR